MAALLDREGNDLYAGTDGTPAQAYAGGVALLIEGQGDDRYLASARFAPTGDGVALWADAEGRDRYGDGRGDAEAAASHASELGGQGGVAPHDQPPFVQAIVAESLVVPKQVDAVVSPK